MQATTTLQRLNGMVAGAPNVSSEALAKMQLGSSE